MKNAEAAIKLDPKFAPAYLLKSNALVKFNGPALIQPEGSREVRVKIYREAAEALEAFLNQVPETSERAIFEQQFASLRFYAVGLSESDVYHARDVTTRARILRKPQPGYPYERRGIPISGKVVLRAVLAADGTVKHIMVLRGLPHGLTESSIKAASQIQFTPSILNGKPVNTFVQLEYNFSFNQSLIKFFTLLK